MEESFSFPTNDARAKQRELILEEIFLLNQRMNLSISECKKLPIPIRKWYINRIIKLSNSNKIQVSKKSHKKSRSEKPAKDIDINKVNKFFSKFDKE